MQVSRKEVVLSPFGLVSTRKTELTNQWTTANLSSRKMELSPVMGLMMKEIGRLVEKSMLKSRASLVNTQPNSERSTPQGRLSLTQEFAITNSPV